MANCSNDPDGKLVSDTHTRVNQPEIVLFPSPTEISRGIKPGAHQFFTTRERAGKLHLAIDKLGRGTTMVNPIDLKTALLAKHAQHVVLIHFPIALFISAVAFDLLAQWTKRRSLADTAYYDLLAAAISTFPAFGTGVLAWQLQLEGQKLQGILLLHLMLACASAVMIWLVWWLHLRARRKAEVLPGYRFAIEFLAVAIIALTGHLGGFLSGVNGPG
jgi:uncharacterized membrane protein